MDMHISADGIVLPVKGQLGAHASITEIFCSQSFGLLRTTLEAVPVMKQIGIRIKGVKQGVYKLDGILDGDQERSLYIEIDAFGGVTEINEEQAIQRSIEIGEWKKVEGEAACGT